MEIKEIDVTNKAEIAQILNSSPIGIESFRYFNKRPLDIIQNHKITVIGFVENTPVAYGHLDSEDGKTWLGVLVADNFHGKGYGSRILNYLIDFGVQNSINSICLSVDNNNRNAIELYEKKGFIKKASKDFFSIYEKALFE